MGRNRRAGFALLAVIWGTGLIALLVVSFMTTGRLRLQTASNIASATQGAYIAEGVIGLAALALLEERDTAAAQGPNARIHDGAPKYCVFDGAAVSLSVEDESGKVDLNAASPELLQATLVALGLDDDAAEPVAKAIVAYRTAPGDIGQSRIAPASDKPFGPKQALFETIMELDQVSGVSPALFRDLLPFVTVHSRNPGVDTRSSPPALFAALTGAPPAIVQSLRAAPYPNSLNREDARFPANFKQAGESGAYLIHVEALLATGQTVAKEAILDTRPPNGKPFALREMRRGQSHFVPQLRQMIATNGAGVPDC